MNPYIIIFTDLDGTLLDEKYSFKKALPALRRINKLKIPLIICSSKTLAEIEVINRRLGNNAPFISENGGGIFIPFRYGLRYPGASAVNGKWGSYRLIRLGAGYAELREALEKLRSEGYMLRGFGDMTAGEVSALTGLGVRDASLARKRDFDEPFIYEGDPKGLKALKRRITMMGLRYTEGELYHIMGNSDKGRAVTQLTGMFGEKHDPVITIGLGDSPNDLQMLKSVDYPVLVRKVNGSWHPVVRFRGLKRANGIGPEGWNTAVLKLLETLAG